MRTNGILGPKFPPKNEVNDVMFDEGRLSFPTISKRRHVIMKGGGTKARFNQTSPDN